MRALTIALMLALAVALVGCAVAETPGPQPDDVIATAPAPAAAPARPARVQIPALNVDSAVIDLGLQENGEMQVPPDAKDAGWYNRSPIPGQPGPAVLAAHVNWKGVDGPFKHLDQLKTGDDILVESADGAEFTFAVTMVETYDKNAFPTDTVYGDTQDPDGAEGPAQPAAELRLITCGGEFDPAAHSYERNIVVFAKADA